MDARALAPASLSACGIGKTNRPFFPHCQTAEKSPRASGQKNALGSCVVHHDFDPRGVLDAVIGQAWLIVDVDLRGTVPASCGVPRPAAASNPVKIALLSPFSFLSALQELARVRSDDIVVVIAVQILVDLFHCAASALPAAAAPGCRIDLLLSRRFFMGSRADFWCSS
jgi:hypothetical protein